MAVILQTQRKSGKPKLLDQVRDAIRLRHSSIRTEQTYTDWIKRFILFHNKRHPEKMAEAGYRLASERRACKKAAETASCFAADSGWKAVSP